MAEAGLAHAVVDRPGNKVIHLSNLRSVVGWYLVGIPSHRLPRGPLND